MGWKVLKAAITASAVLMLSQIEGQSAADTPERNMQRLRIGLALGGGGTRGAAHIGVLRVLEQEHIPIDCIAGTSVGSVIGGLYASGVPLDQIQKMFEDKSLMHAYNRVPITCSIVWTPLSMIPRLFGVYHFVGLYRGDKFARFIEASLPPSRKEIENTKIPFRPVSTDLLSGQPFAPDHGPLAEAIQASSALPWLKKPVQLQGKVLCDGFLAGANLPVAQARAMGADLVICVDVDGLPECVSTADMRHIRTFRHRINNVMISCLDQSEAESADLLLRPDVGDLGILSTRSCDVERAVRAGEYVARQALGRIRKAAHIERWHQAIRVSAGGVSADSADERAALKASD
jgi:NTE family protein